MPSESASTAQPQGGAHSTNDPPGMAEKMENNGAPFGSWMISQRNRRRPVRVIDGSSDPAATPPSVTVNGGAPGRRPTAARSRGGSSRYLEAGSRCSVLNEMEDVEAFDETVDNGNDAWVGVSQKGVANRRPTMDKGKEPMTTSKQTGAQSGPKVNVSHASLGHGLKGTREVDNVEAGLFGKQATGPTKNKEKVLNDITNKVDSRPNSLHSSRQGQQSGPTMRSRDLVGQGVKRVNHAIVAEEVIEIIHSHAAQCSAQVHLQEMDIRQTGGRPPDPPPTDAHKETPSCPSSLLGRSQKGGTEACGGHGDIGQTDGPDEEMCAEPKGNGGMDPSASSS